MKRRPACRFDSMDRAREAHVDTSAMLEKFEALCINRAQRWLRPDLDLQHLIHEARVGLFKACQTFDPSKGALFWQYADWSIRVQLRYYVFGLGSVWIPFKRLGEGFREVPIDAPLNNDSDLTLADLLPSGESPAAEHAHLSDNIEAVMEALKMLKPAYREAIEGIYLEGLFDRQVAAKLGITRQAVNQRVHAGLRKLRWHLRNQIREAA